MLSDDLEMRVREVLDAAVRWNKADDTFWNAGALVTSAVEDELAEAQSSLKSAVTEYEKRSGRA